MNLLLDTVVLLWWQMDDSHLPESGRQWIVDAEMVFVSSVSVWEIEIKRSVGKLSAPNDLAKASLRLTRPSGTIPGILYDKAYPAFDSGSFCTLRVLRRSAVSYFLLRTVWVRTVDGWRYSWTYQGASALGGIGQSFITLPFRRPPSRSSTLLCFAFLLGFQLFWVSGIVSFPASLNSSAGRSFPFCGSAIGSRRPAAESTQLGYINDYSNLPAHS